MLINHRLWIHFICMVEWLLHVWPVTCSPPNHNSNIWYWLDYKFRLSLFRSGGVTNWKVKSDWVQFCINGILKKMLTIVFSSHDDSKLHRMMQHKWYASQYTKLISNSGASSVVDSCNVKACLAYIITMYNVRVTSHERHDIINHNKLDNLFNSFIG